MRQRSTRARSSEMKYKSKNNDTMPPHLYLQYHSPLLSHDDRRQTQVDISMVENIGTRPLDPCDHLRSARYMARYAVADVSQGG